MGQAKDAPDHNVLVEDVVVAVRGVADAADLPLALERVATAGEELVVLVSCDPEVVLCEKGSLGLAAVGVCEEQLGCRRDDLVPDGSLGDGVDLVQILNLEDTVVKWCGIQTGRCGDWRVAHLVQVALGVGALVKAKRKAFFLDDGVFVPVD